MSDQANTEYQEWSVQSLATVIPILASTFAFAFVVGYFLAFDISWFPFFSLSEHIVFALRALPIAVGASVVFLIALRYPEIEARWPYLKGKGRWFAVGWICILVVAALVAFLGAHFALFLSFCLIAAGMYVYYRMPAPHLSFASVLYWAVITTFLSLMIGYVSANSWKFAWRVDRCIGYRLFLLQPSISIRLGDSGEPIMGQVIFVGNAGVLFYEYKSRTTHLIQRNSLSDISDVPEKVADIPKSPTESALPSQQPHGFIPSIRACVVRFFRIGGASSH
jgi:hypothetical protein